jgi:hypothetical protein
VTGRLTTSNHALDRLFGHEERFLREQTYVRWLSDSNRQFREDITTVYRTGKPVFVAEYELDTTGGGTKKHGAVPKITVRYQISPLLASSTESERSRMIESGRGRGVSVDKEPLSPRSPNVHRYQEPLSPLSPNVQLQQRYQEPLSPLSPNHGQQPQPQPNGIVIILEDINERKVMEQKLKKYKTRLRLLETKMVRGGGVRGVRVRGVRVRGVRGERGEGETGRDEG